MSVSVPVVAAAATTDRGRLSSLEPRRCARAKRWCAAGMLNAVRSFRRLAALRRHAQQINENNVGGLGYCQRRVEVGSSPNFNTKRDMLIAPPPDGWFSTVASYLLATFIFGTLLINLWEEAAWQGLVQRHLERRQGLAQGAARTAIPFALLHIPIAFVGGVSLGRGLATVALLFAYAPVFRYVMGRTDRATGRSLLAVGVMHAAFNASGSLDVLDGGWQPIGGMAVVGAALFAADA